MVQNDLIHGKLDCGIELGVQPLPARQTVCVQIRFLAGFVHEPVHKLGLNHVVEQTVSKGTARRSGRELSDAFDALGVRWSSWAGREATAYQFTCLPEFLDPAWELHAEFLRTPAFPQDALEVAVENMLQDLANLSDDPHELSTKLMSRQVYGPVLGRHVLGDVETLRSIGAADVRSHWEQCYQTGRMQAAVAGPVDAPRLTDKLNELFAGSNGSGWTGRERLALDFEQQRTHHHKELEQEHIGICYPGASLDDPWRYAQRVAMAVLSGGMSCRLFTEVREKQGLVYWVTASTEHPRGIGMVYLGASTKPQRCEQTYRTLLREIDRLGEDLEQAELQRAITGIVARVQTRGDITQARCNELADDLFHYGRLIPVQEKVARIRAVTIADVKAYLNCFPRHRLSVLTLGPRALNL